MAPVEPLTPADCDLRDFAFMPLDVVRLRDSDLAATESAEVFRAAVMLWCASWHQLPAASLPDDDRVLSNLAGYGRVVKEWVKIRQGALRGWVECTDGRLYHAVVAEKAVEAWRGKLERQWRTECARIKKHAQRHEITLPTPEFDEWIAAGRPQGHPLPVPRDKESMSTGQESSVPGLSSGKQPPRDRDRDSGQGQGQGQINKTPRTPQGVRFTEFWQAWPANSPRKVGKAACEKAWIARKLDLQADAILAHVAVMRQTDQWQRGFEPAPATYLNQRRWEDGSPEGGDLLADSGVQRV